jgi:hypothetical protein
MPHRKRNQFAMTADIETDEFPKPPLEGIAEDRWDEASSTAE